MTSIEMTAPALPTYRFPSLSRFPLKHGLSMRVSERGHDGDVGHGRDTDEKVIEANRSAYLRSLEIEPRDLILGRQTHGVHVQVVATEDRGRGLYPAFDGFPGTDGLATSSHSIAVGVIVADCVPLILYDCHLHAVCVVHAGWRGTVGLIAERAVAVMLEAFGSRPGDIWAGIGPSIGPCCYEVGDDVIDAWSAASNGWGSHAVDGRKSSYHFDLWAANRLTLERCGVPAAQIESSSICVRCRSDRYFSYRATRQAGYSAGRMLMAAQLCDRNGDGDSKQGERR